jgi:prefoldin subunit 5
MNHIKVKEKDHLVRDIDNNAIINTDIDGYNEYVEIYKNKINSVEKIKNLENQIYSLKDDINEIKTLLRNLTNGS